MVIGAQGKAELLFFGKLAPFTSKQFFLPIVWAPPPPSPPQDYISLTSLSQIIIIKTNFKNVKVWNDNFFCTYGSWRIGLGTRNRLSWSTESGPKKWVWRKEREGEWSSVHGVHWRLVSPCPISEPQLTAPYRNAHEYFFNLLLFGIYYCCRCLDIFPLRRKGLFTIN